MIKSVWLDFIFLVRKKVLIVSTKRIRNFNDFFCAFNFDREFNSFVFVKKTEIGIFRKVIYLKYLLAKNERNRSIGIKAMRLGKIFGLSTFPVFRHCPTFDSRNMSGISVSVENIPKYSTFDIPRKSVHFCEINWSSKLLPKRMALVEGNKVQFLRLM